MALDVTALAARLRNRFGWDGLPRGAGGPALLLLSGLPGTGKSYLAAAIATRHPAIVVRSDEVRKAIFEHPTYSVPESGVVYRTCYELIRLLLHDGHVVVFDATNLERDGRRHARRLAERAGAAYLTLVTEAPLDVVAARLGERLAGRSEAYGSDADWDVHAKLSEVVQPVNTEREAAVVVDTSQGIEPALAAVDRLLAAAPPRRIVGEDSPESEHDESQRDR